MDSQGYQRLRENLTWRAAYLSQRYGELPRNVTRLWLWAERRVEEIYSDRGESIASYIWWNCCAGPGYVNYWLDRVLWELTYALGLPPQGRDRKHVRGPEELVDLGYFTSLRDFSYQVFPDYLPLGPIEGLLDLIEDFYASQGGGDAGPDLDSALEEFSVSLQDAIAESISYIESSREMLLGYFREQIDETYGILSKIQDIMEPRRSQFIAYKDGYFFFPFRDPKVEGIQVIPNGEQGGVVTNPNTPLRCRTNLFDVICLGFHTILSYLGAHRYPRPYYYPDDVGESPPQFQIPNLADHVSQIHQELRDGSLCAFEVRTGPNEGDREQVYTTVNEAVASIAGAVSEIALDAQRAHLLSAQAARTAMTVSAQIGTATFPGTVDLGWRGQVTAPGTNAASIAQILASIEASLNELSIALGVAPRGEQ